MSDITFEEGLFEIYDEGLISKEEVFNLLEIEQEAELTSYDAEPDGKPEPEPEREGRAILVKDFRGTGLGKKSIEHLANCDPAIVTVEALHGLGIDGINDLPGISDRESLKIWNRVKELLSD